jgi:hypothetical protein
MPTGKAASAKQLAQKAEGPAHTGVYSPRAWCAAPCTPELPAFLQAACAQRMTAAGPHLTPARDNRMAVLP